MFVRFLQRAITAGTISAEAGMERLLVRYEIRFTALLSCVALFATGAVPADVFTAGRVSNWVPLVLLLLGLAYVASVALAAARFFMFLSAILDRASIAERAEDG